MLATSDPAVGSEMARQIFFLPVMTARQTSSFISWEPNLVTGGSAIELMLICPNMPPPPSRAISVHRMSSWKLSKSSGGVPPNSTGKIDPRKPAR